MVSLWQPVLIFLLVLLSLFIGLTFNSSSSTLNFESAAVFRETKTFVASNDTSRYAEEVEGIRPQNESTRSPKNSSSPIILSDRPPCPEVALVSPLSTASTVQGWTTIRDVTPDQANLTVLPAWGKVSNDPVVPQGQCGDYSFAKAHSWSSPAAATDVCAPAHRLGTAVRCYTEVRVDGGKRQMCDSQNIALDLSHLSLVVGHPVGPDQPNTIIGDCKKAGGWKDLWLPLQAGASRNLAGLTEGPLQCDFWVEHPVYLLTRYGVMSMYHSMEDIETIFSIFTSLGLPLETTQLVVVDHLTPGYTFTWQDLDLLFIRAFSRGRPIMHAEEFAKLRPIRRLCFRRAIWGASPQNSMVSWHAGSPLPCGKQDLFPALARHLLDSMTLVPSVDPEAIRITFNLRGPDEHKDLRANAAALPHVSVQAVQFIRYTLRQQIAIAMDTDIMVGTHGAGMTLLMYMPGHGAVIELPRADRMGNYHYRNLASLCGLLYTDNGNALNAIVQQVMQRRDASLPPALRKPGKWQQCSKEGQTCTLEHRAMVRFGQGRAWSSRMADAGGLRCVPTSFAEDPKPLVPKTCQYWHVT